MAWEQRYAELEAMVADLCVSKKEWRSGSDHLERSGDDRRFGGGQFRERADKEIPKASSMPKRRYKLQKRISCEELDERTMKGLCVFCGEEETLYHHLQHKNDVILMFDSEDHLSDSMVNKIGNPEEQALDDEELVETEVATGSIETEHETMNLVPDLENHEGWEQIVILEEESIPQSKVPIANFEILKSIEPGKVDLGLENLEYAVLNKNLEQEWDQQNVNKKIDVDGDVVYSPWVSVKRDGAVETQTCISRQANHVWKPGGFVHPKIQLDWLERADSNQEKESNKKLRKLKRRRQQKFHKTRQSKFKQQPRRNMVYTTCLRILRGGKEQERSTQVKLFKNWKFKYKHKHPLRILPCNAQHGFRGRKKSMCKLRPQQRLCVLEILEQSMVPSLLSSVSVSRGILHPNESDFIEWSELLFGAYLRRDNIQQKRRKEKGFQSWKFKFKTDSKSARTNHILLQEKKPSKSPKSWKFKFKLSLEDTDFVFKMDRWCRAPYVKWETESFLEIEVLQEDVQHVHVAFLHMNANETRYAVRKPTNQEPAIFQPILRFIMNTKQSCLSLRANRVWDPGGSNSEND